MKTILAILLMSVLLVGCGSGEPVATEAPLPTVAQSQQYDLSKVYRETHPGEATDDAGTPAVNMQMEHIGEITADSLSVVGANDSEAGYCILDFSSIAAGDCYTDGNPVEIKNPGDVTLEIYNCPRDSVLSEIAVGLYNTETMQAYGCISQSTDIRNYFLTTEKLPAGTYEFFVQYLSGEEITVGLVTYQTLENDPA